MKINYRPLIIELFRNEVERVLGIRVVVSRGGWLAAKWTIRYGDRLSTLVLIDPLGLRVQGAPLADNLSLDGATMRQTLFGDANASLA
ncbi:MAG TPA: hypothetical protein VNT76_00510 [Candidatus Binatus sp.]|nr:hypothetical protein [Candidatus Binatus sp.]